MKTRERSLFVIGAGPKALALVSKNAVLRRLGFAVPKITIVEKTGIAAHWTGTSGFTNGKLPLGTSPEKDVGFPYSSFCWGGATNPIVDTRMQEYSWQSFLIADHTYSDWVDRGKPAPNHKRWAEYLRWVFGKVQDEASLVLGEVVSVSLKEEHWSLETKLQSGEVVKHEADGLVLTGPGIPKFPPIFQNDDRIVTVQKFWTNVRSYTSRHRARFAIVGTGENAASIAVTLGLADNELAVDIISPVATNYSRGESYVENHIYSDPFQGNWFQLTMDNRRDFIYRTDRGVFSVVTKQMLDGMDCIEIIPGRLTKVEVDSLNQLIATVQYDSDCEKRAYDFVIIATGFDHLKFLRDLLDENSEREMLRRSQLNSLSLSIVEESIDENLALNRLTPRLHLPILSAISQGPGFANLSCLGRLSDQILAAYVPLADG